MYKLSFCDPFVPQLVEMGDFPPEKVIGKFEEIRWADHLYYLRDAGKLRDYFCPSFSIEDAALKRGLEVSVVDHDEKEEWFIFYKRPETVRTWLGFRKEFREAHVSNVCGQSRRDVIECLDAFVRRDFDFLNQKLR